MDKKLLQSLSAIISKMPKKDLEKRDRMIFIYNFE